MSRPRLDGALYFLALPFFVPPNMISEQAASPTVNLNQEAYQRLKTALSLNLRRQVFIAVCDNLRLRDQLAGQITAELAPSHQERSADWSITNPLLINLELDLSAPDPMVQINQWFVQSPNRRQRFQQPVFQLLDTECLTHQSAATQNRFLNALQRMGQTQRGIDFTLVVWLTRPWFYAVQQSAPAFWQTRNGIFEFEGDPTPVPIVTISPEAWVATMAFAPQDVDLGGDIGGDLNTAGASSGTNGGISQGTSGVPKDLASDAAWQSLGQDLEQLGQQPQDQLKQDQPKQNQPNQEPAAELRASPDSGIADEPLQPSSDQVSTPPIVPGEATPAATLADQGAALLNGVQSLLPAKALPSLLPTIYPNFELAGWVQACLPSALDQHGDRARATLETLDQIQQLSPLDAVDADLAQAYRYLGNLYRDRIEQGDSGEAILAIAIYSYEQALQMAGNQHDGRADLLNDLGNLYWMLSRQALFAPSGLINSSPAPAAGNQVAHQRLLCLEQAIAAYLTATQWIRPEQAPQSYAMIQNNLGSAYGDLANYHEPAASLAKSINAYREALMYRTPEDNPARYAATQNNLGTAYWNLAQYEQPVTYLQQAIVAYGEALRFYDPQREALYYAMLQNNLGTAYWNLSQHKNTQWEGAAATPLDWLLKAIEAYRAALQHRTFEAAPTAHAATQNNLGTAYWHLATLPALSPEVRKEFFQQAITAYEAAIGTVTLLQQADPAVGLTFDPFATHNNLGLAHYQIATDKQSALSSEQRFHTLELALEHHVIAIQGWQNKPEFYQAALGYVIQTIRICQDVAGMKGQNQALSKVPAALLPEVMVKL
jgi:tetratricopeptide (TPR) repeat protein